MKEKAYAKINLFLNVVEKRLDGYHELNMITHPIELHDTITIDFSNEDKLSGFDVEDNIIWKAVNLFRAKFNIKQRLDIVLEKKIPIGAGLGGGSADAAATLRILNSIFDTRLSLDQLAELGVELGADVPMCIFNKPAIVHGIGEKMKFIGSLNSKLILIIPEVSVSTKNVFDNSSLIKMERKNSSNLLEAIGNNDIQNVMKNTLNDLTHITTQLYEECTKILQLMEDKLPIYCMTGSGSVFYRIYNDDEELTKDKKMIESLGINHIVTELFA